MFWVAFVATVCWILVSNLDYGLATGLFGESGSRLVMTLLLGWLVLASGVLLLYHRRSAGDEEYWTGWELIYALVLFLSLVYGVYSFFGWFFYG